jgi:hypothetical protein
MRNRSGFASTFGSMKIIQILGKYSVPNSQKTFRVSITRNNNAVGSVLFDRISPAFQRNVLVEDATSTQSEKCR